MHCCAGLEELELSRNDFSEVPRALAAATSLRTLDLTECPNLRLAEADVHDVLLRLPRLARLSVGTRTWLGRGRGPGAPRQRRAVLDVLRRERPGLQIELGAGGANREAED